MDNTISFAELILKFWNTILKYIWPLFFRHEGFNIIKKRMENRLKSIKIMNDFVGKFLCFKLLILLICVSKLSIVQHILSDLIVAVLYLITL